MIEINGTLFLFPIPGNQGKDCYANGCRSINGKLVNCACEYCMFSACCAVINPQDCGKCSKDCFRKSLARLL